jgi:hypothetical protein
MKREKPDPISGVPLTCLDAYRKIRHPDKNAAWGAVATIQTLICLNKKCIITSVKFSFMQNPNSDGNSATFTGT